MEEECLYAKSRSWSGTRSWYDVTPRDERSIWINRASRGRFDRPLSWREVRGTDGFEIGRATGAGCEGAAC